MAGTTSANPRGLIAPGAAFSAAGSRIANTLSRLDNFITYRRIALTGAGMLGVLGFVASTRSATLLAAILFVSSLAVLGLCMRAEARTSLSTKSLVLLSPGVSSMSRSEVLSARYLSRRDEAALADCPWVGLASRVSHELRTPLNAVLGFSEIMAAEMFGPLGDEKYLEYVGHIRKSGQSLLKSADDILAITSLLAGSASATTASGVSVADVVEDVLSVVGPEIDHRGITLENGALSTTEVIGDPRAHRQIVTNLLTEALRHAGEHGTIALATSVTGCTLKFHVAAERAIAAAKIPVSQTGSLAMSLTETLTDLQGLVLTQQTCGSHGWAATVQFECAVQADFFKRSA